MSTGDKRIYRVASCAWRVSRRPICMSVWGFRSIRPFLMQIHILFKNMIYFSFLVLAVLSSSLIGARSIVARIALLGKPLKALPMVTIG